MADSREGGCQCGAVRYRIRGEPLVLAACHCTECQRQSGSAFGLSLVVRAADLELLCGEPNEFSRSSDSGRPIRCFFCGSCGTRVYHQPSYAQGVLNVKAGTLDDTSSLEPDLHAWTRSKQPWVTLPAGVKFFEGQPG